MDRVMTGKRRQKRERGQDCRWATGYGNGELVGNQGSGKLGMRAGEGAGLQFIGGPPSSRAEGLLVLHGLESNPGSPLQTEEEAGLP